MKTSPITQFVDTHYKHFNAGALRDAAIGYKTHIEKGGKMFLTMGGAMSTGELGISLAEMIRQGKVHAISCTGANLEEDVYNLVAHEHYERIPNYRDLTPQDEEKLLARHLNRVTDTCIPEEEAIRRIENEVLEEWQKASKAGVARLPHEYLYEVLLSGKLDKSFQIPRENSWLMAAAERKLPLFVPGWEDSTMGNIFTARVMEEKVSAGCMKAGFHYLIELAKWYEANCRGNQGIGFFQIAGGISGDFPICVVPMLNQDLEKNVPVWAYFCQISDSTTSYGSYSGAVPNEKITWGKLSATTPKFMIESDATIVAPLVFGYVLGW